MEKFDRCILCGSLALKNMPRYAKDYLCRCSNCGFVFSRVKPSEEKLSSYYQNYSYSREHYVSPITLKRYKELLMSFESYRKTGRLLDVGCGNGLFLDVARELGWDAWGTEFSERAVEVCKNKGLYVLKGTLTELKDMLPEMDIIVSIEVIEHINNPDVDVKLFNRILRRGGLLYITTPNFNALARYWQKENYKEIAWPEHLSYYTPTTLVRLMKRHRFRKKKVLTTGLSISRLPVQSKNKAENPFTSESKDERLRQKLEYGFLMPLLKRWANWLLTLSGTGLALKGYFEKE